MYKFEHNVNIYTFKQHVTYMYLYLILFFDIELQPQESQESTPFVRLIDMIR